MWMMNNIPEKDYFEIFKLDVKNVLTIAWSQDMDTIIVTKNDNERIKFHEPSLFMHHITVGKWLFMNLPENWEFIGFQHDDQGNSYTAFAKMTTVKS